MTFSPVSECQEGMILRAPTCPLLAVKRNWTKEETNVVGGQHKGSKDLAPRVVKTLN